MEKVKLNRGKFQPIYYAIASVDQGDDGVVKPWELSRLRRLLSYNDFSNSGLYVRHLSAVFSRTERHAASTCPSPFASHIWFLVSTSQEREGRWNGEEAEMYCAKTRNVLPNLNIACIGGWTSILTEQYKQRGEA